MGTAQGFQPGQMDAFNQMLQYGTNNGSIPNSSAAAGSTASAAGAGGLQGGLYGLANYNPNINMGQTVADANSFASGINIPAQVKAAMQPAEQEAAYSLNPGIDASAAATGNVSGSRDAIEHGLVATNLGQTAANIGANLEANAYTTGAGLSSTQQQANAADTLQALAGQTYGGALGVNSGTNANTGAVGQQTGLFNIAQGGINGQNNDPFAALNNFYNIIGNKSWGGTTNSQGTSIGQSTTTTDPSQLAQIGAWTNLIGNFL